MADTNGVKEKKEKTLTIRRSYALKLVKGSDTNRLLDFCQRSNALIGAIMRSFALLLDWNGGGESPLQSRNAALAELKEISPELASFVQQCWTLPQEEQQQLRGWIFFLVLCGARSWDGFFAASANKKRFGSVTKQLVEAQEKAAKNVGSDEVLQAFWAKEVSLLGDAAKLLEVLEQQVDQPELSKPLAAAAERLAILPRQLRTLVVTAVCQKLLGHYELLSLWQQEAAQWRAEKQAVEASPEYQQYLEFGQANPDLLAKLYGSNRNRKVFNQVLRDPAIREFYGEKLDLPENLSIQGLVQRSAAIAWFRKNHALYCKFRAFKKRPPTLTFVSQEHPFHLTLPGPLTDDSWYRLMRMPTKDAPGVLRLNLPDKDGTVLLSQHEFNGRPELSSLMPENGHVLFGTSPQRKATLGGLRLRPKDGAVFCDLVLNIEQDRWSAAAQALSFDKQSFAWKCPDRLSVGVFLYSPNGLWAGHAMIENAEVVAPKSGALKRSEQRWAKLPKVTLPDGKGRRNATDHEHGKLLQAVQRKLPLAMEVAGADKQTRKEILAHLEQRNQRARNKTPDTNNEHSLGIGRLLEEEQQIDSLVSKLKRTERALNEVKHNVEFRETLSKERSAVIQQLKALRYHVQRCRDDLIRKTVAVAVETACAAKYDVVILPGNQQKDSGYRRSAVMRNTAQNRCLSVARIGEFYDRLADALGLVGIRTVRLSTLHTATLCPKCGQSGELFIERRDEQGNRERVAVPIGNTSLGLESVPRFACSATSVCSQNVDSRHVVVCNLFQRFTLGKQFAPPKAVSKPSRTRKVKV